MNIVRVFDWFARDSAYAAEHTDEPRQRDIWIKLAELWKAAALAEETRQERRSLVRLGETFMKRTSDDLTRSPGSGSESGGESSLPPRFRVTGFLPTLRGPRP